MSSNNKYEHVASWKAGHHRHRLSVVQSTSLNRIPKPNPTFSPTFIRYLFLLSFVWQIANVCIIVLTDVASVHEKHTLDIAVAIMLFFQIIHIGLVISTSIKLCKQVLHKTASTLFVVQSFLSTTLLFAGLYTLLYPNIKKGFDDDVFNTTPSGTFHVFVKFIYFSTATMTTVGYGDVTPTAWYTQLIVTTEMMLSVTYTALIFGQGLSHFAHSPSIIVEHDVDDDDSLSINNNNT